MKTTIGRISLVLLLFGACTDEELLSPSASRQPSASASAVALPASVEGEVGGALYALHVPADWNGQLVLYAHGIRDVGTPVDLRDQDGYYATRDALLARGFAFAYSSFPANGLAIKEGAQRTRQVEAMFATEFALPDRTYLMGHSLGGVIALKLAEQHPNAYAGVVPMCAQIGGIQATADYFAHVRVLFDYFYPDVLPGDALTVPAGLDLNSQVILPALMAIQGDGGQGAGAIARIMVDMGMPVPASSAGELVQSILTAIGFGFRAVPDLLERTHGHSPFDNSTTVYSSAALPPALLADVNARVDRFTSSPDATTYLRQYYQPSGDVAVPVLTLFNRLDPVSTPFHEPAYAARVADSGSTDLLLQRPSANLYGHCNFTAAEVVQAFTDLVEWQETGVKPAG